MKKWEWTPEINARFTKMWLEGCGVKSMAHEFGLPPRAIVRHRELLGLPKRRGRYTAGKYVAIYFSNEEYEALNGGASRRRTSKSQYLRGLVRLDAAASASMEA